MLITFDTRTGDITSTDIITIKEVNTLYFMVEGLGEDIIMEGKDSELFSYQLKQAFKNEENS